MVDEFMVEEYYHVKINRQYHKMDAIIFVYEINEIAIKYYIIHGFEKFGITPMEEYYKGARSHLNFDKSNHCYIDMTDLTKLDRKLCENLYD